MAKYKLYGELLNEDNILSHVFLNCIPKELSKKISDDSDKLLETLDKETFRKNREIDLTLTIEGIEVDCKKFFTILWEQYEELIKKEATKIIEEQTSNTLYEFNNKLNELTNKIKNITENIKWNYNIDSKKILLKNKIIVALIYYITYNIL